MAIGRSAERRGIQQMQTCVLYWAKVWRDTINTTNNECDARRIHARNAMRRRIATTFVDELAIMGWEVTGSAGRVCVGNCKCVRQRAPDLGRIPNKINPFEPYTHLPGGRQRGWGLACGGDF